MARSSLSYQPVPERGDNQRLRRLLDEIYLKDPCLGSRRLVTVLERDHGLVVNRNRLQRLRREAIWCRPRITIPDFTSMEWTGVLLEQGIRISMDGIGRWMDNGFIERRWRRVKYEEIYLREHATLGALRTGLADWFKRYNEWRPHEALGHLTPAAFCQEALVRIAASAEEMKPAA